MSTPEEASPATPASPRARRSRGRTRRALEWPIMLGIALVLALVVRSLLAEVFFIPSGSMEPTLHGCVNCSDADRVLVSKLDRHRERFEVIVFDGGGSFNPTPQDAPSGVRYVKRVIGLPGETVSCCDPQGRVLINGKPLMEQHAGVEGTEPFEPVTLGPNEIWVMGDNRPGSSDSRVHGPVSQDAVVGRAVWIVWPPSRLGRL